MENPAMQIRTVLKSKQGRFQEIEDVIAEEYPLTVKLNGEEFATIVCSPTHLEEMVVGFLASEGVIRFAEEIVSLSLDQDRGFAYVELKQKQKQKTSVHFYAKRFIGSCCGKSRQFYFHNDVKTARTITHALFISVQNCFDLMEEMQQQSTDFQQTGGIHNAALASVDGILLSRSDIGRHNALDKIYGYCVRNRVPMTDKIIIFSGRISSEIVLKTAKMGVGILLSKSAPTTLALDLADDLGITAVGFIRGDRLNIYTHFERIEQPL